MTKGKTKAKPKVKKRIVSGVKGMTAKQLLFCKEYLIDFNATQAALRAGYSSATAYSIGWENLRKPELSKYIQSCIQERIMTADETKKLISDIARGSLNDYMTIRKVVRTPQVEKKLSQIYNEMKERWLFEEEFIARCGLSEEMLKPYQHANANLDLEIFRVKMELERNPNAKRIVWGEPEFVEVAELDLIKLSKDKENGKIKSIIYTKDGPRVELHDASAALRDLTKIHGINQTNVNVSGGLDFTGFLIAHNTVDDE